MAFNPRKKGADNAPAQEVVETYAPSSSHDDISVNEEIQLTPESVGSSRARGGGSQDPNDYSDDRSIYDSITSVSQFLGGPLNLNQTDVRVDQTLKLFDEVLKSLNKNKMVGSFEIVEFDSWTVNKPYPAIIAAHRVLDARGALLEISYAVMLVETEYELPHASIGGRDNLSLPITAFEVYDGSYDEAVRNTIWRAVCNGDTTIPLRYSGVSCLYRETEVKDVKQASLLFGALLQQCVSATIEETLVTDDATVNLGDYIREKGLELVATLDTRTSGIVGVDGLPIHTDVKVSTKAMPPRPSREDRDRRDRDRGVYTPMADNVVDVGAIVDLVRVQQSNRRFGSRRDSYATRSRRDEDYPFLGNVIITWANNPRGMVTLASALLAVSTAVIAQSDEVYPQLFKPNRDNTLGDIGSIGYQVPDDEGNYGRIDVNSAAFTLDGDNALYKLVYETVDPELMLCIDIPEVILGSRAIKTIGRTQEGDAGKAALNRIVHTLDNLTDGSFSVDYWDGKNVVGAPIALIPIGYWVDARGNHRDLREIDYLAALEYSGSKDDPNFIEDWIDSYANKDLEAGAALRIELMGRIVGHDNIHVKTFALRYPFLHDFVEAIAESTQDAGIAPTFQNLNEGQRTRIEETRSAYQDYLVSHERTEHYAANARYRPRGRGDGSSRGRSNTWR